MLNFDCPCPFKACSARIPAHQICCERHRLLLSPTQEQTARAAFADWQANQITDEELIAAYKGIMDQIKGTVRR